MKITVYELLGKVKDEPDISIYVKYFDRINKKEDVMWACKENIIYKLEQLVIELNDIVEILEEEKKTIDDLNLSLQEIEAFQEARQIFLKLNNEEDKQTFIKLLLGEGTYERWIDYLKSKGE